MFRDEKQRYDVIRTLLEFVGLEYLWKPTGPSEVLVGLATRGEVFHGESAEHRAVISLVWHLYTGTKIALTVADVNAMPTVSRRVFSLMSSISDSHAEIDYWLLCNERMDRGSKLKHLRGYNREAWARIIVQSLDRAGSASRAHEPLGVSERQLRRWLHDPAIKTLAPGWAPRSDETEGETS